jgi:lysophospholipid acyltransferase (LPLAT)-like uncharacterized protein
MRVAYHDHYRQEKQYLGAFWHGKVFLPLFFSNQHQTKMAVLVSPSRDGDIISDWLNRVGYETIRGSSRRNNVGALAEMLRKLKSGYSIGIIVDGPLGPRHKVKPGIAHMAQKLGVEIVPVGVYISRKWTLNSWDKFELPKPFCKGAVYCHQPISVPENASLEEYIRLVEDKIHEAETIAKTLAV